MLPLDLFWKAQQAGRGDLDSSPSSDTGRTGTNPSVSTSPTLSSENAGHGQAASKGPSGFNTHLGLARQRQRRHVGGGRPLLPSAGPCQRQLRVFTGGQTVALVEPRWGPMPG